MMVYAAAKQLMDYQQHRIRTETIAKMEFWKKIPWWAPAGGVGLIFVLHLIFVFLVSDPQIRSLSANALVILAGLVAAISLLITAFRLKQDSWVHAKRIAAAWFLFALAQFSTIIGDSLWMYFEQILHQQPFPSTADIFYLLFYPVFLIGFLRFPFRESSLNDWLKTSTDMLIVMLAAILILWNFILGPVLMAGSGQPLLMQFLALAYPVGDLILLWAVLVIIYRIPRNSINRPLWVLAVGLSVIIVTDSVFVYQEIISAFQSYSIVNLGYTLGYLLFALAALYQVHLLNQDKPLGEISARPSSSNLLVFLPYAWSAGAFLVLSMGNQVPIMMTLPQVITFVGAITALVIVRQFIVLQENQRLSKNLQDALARVRVQAEVLVKTNQEMQLEIIERRRAEERLSYDALHDALTGLPNRALFLDRLTQAAKKRQRNKNFHYSVLFLDLDSFKVINDSLGHVTGDQLLIHTARVLSSCLRVTDTVARLGGDEFVILLDDTGTSDQVFQTANRLQEELGQPINLDGTRVVVSVSIGIVLNVAEYDRPEDVLRDADLAMYQAKSNGKARYEIFHTDMRASILMRLSMENEMRKGLECGEFVLHYQPILSLPDNNLVGFEALVRWNHPERGLVEPSVFIPVAEETGLILPLGRWIMHAACQQASEWRDRFPMASTLKVGVNVSGRQLLQPDFVDTVSDALFLANLPARCLAIEVTESVCLDSGGSISGTLEALQKLGVEIQIDDFGTGYSSLSYLQRLPVRSIKIDKSFIHAINSSGNAPDIIRAILAMAHNLGIKAVAEGIETEVQAAELNRLHCSFAQGFWYARPMDRVAMEKWLVSNRKVPQTQ
jgi:diguanylate cyclase (GGDEF)-like protein